ncbi:MAG: hypothetical protein FI703_06975 [SAR202 cluster bacterium]|nr:hypothetical protein [SAR202 cluster bacterium]
MYPLRTRPELRQRPEVLPETRLISATLAVVGVFLALSVAGQVTEEARAMFDASVSDNTIFTIVSYTTLIVASLMIARLVAKITKSIPKVLTLGMSGMVDKLGGIALGATFGVAIAAVVVLVGAKIAYDFDAEAIKAQLPAQVAEKVTSERLATVEEPLGAIEGVLEESQAVAILLSVTDTLPESTLNMVRGDFRTALDIMRSKGIGKDGISILSPP